jgi:hypothetical protein
MNLHSAGVPIKLLWLWNSLGWEANIIFFCTVRLTTTTIGQAQQSVHYEMALTSKVSRYQERQSEQPLTEINGRSRQFYTKAPASPSLLLLGWFLNCLFAQSLPDWSNCNCFHSAGLRLHTGNDCFGQREIDLKASALNDSMKNMKILIKKNLGNAL